MARWSIPKPTVLQAPRVCGAGQRRWQHVDALAATVAAGPPSSGRDARCSRRLIEYGRPFCPASLRPDPVMAPLGPPHRSGGVAQCRSEIPYRSRVAVAGRRWLAVGARQRCTYTFAGEFAGSLHGEGLAVLEPEGQPVEERRAQRELGLAGATE